MDKKQWDPLQIERPTQTKSKGMEKVILWKWKQTKNYRDQYLNKIDFKTEAKKRNKRTPSNSTSGYLSEENQNTNFKRHMNFIVTAAFCQWPAYANNLSVHECMNE